MRILGDVMSTVAVCVEISRLSDVLVVMMKGELLPFILGLVNV